MNIKKYCSIIIILAFSTLSSQTIVALENFKLATLVEPLDPEYPKKGFSDRSGVQSTDSGLVELSFMVNDQGSPNEIAVVNASHPKFIEQAIKAIRSGKFSPAYLNGKAINSKLSLAVEFVFTATDRQDSRGSTSNVGIRRVRGLPDRYSSFYEKFNEEMQGSSPNERKASTLLKKMEIINHQNFYSLAYLSLAKYRFSEKFGTKEQSADALKDLIAFDGRVTEKHQILKDDLELTILTGLLKLQIEAGQFAEAIRNYKAFSIVEPKIESMFSAPMEKIIAIKDNKESVTERKISLGEPGDTHLPLLKRSFMLDEVEGNVSDLKLRCDTRFAKLAYKADGQYDIPVKWGECDLQIIGDIGTTATLLQQ